MARKRAKKRGKRKSARLSPKAYNAMLRKLALLKRKGKRGAWGRLKQTASAYRARMVAANRLHPTDALPLPTYSNTLVQEMPQDYREWYEETARNPRGRQMLELSKKFHRVPFPPVITKFNIGGKGKKFIMGLGWTNQVHIASKRPKPPTGRKRDPEVKRRVVRGRWFVSCNRSGKGIMIFTGQPFRPPWVKVGYAPETHYIPPKELEAAGTPKAGFQWRHKHDDDGGTWPEVWADHGGRLGRFTNFKYKGGTYIVDDWIRR